jgi:hypothetical protein
VVSVHDRCKHVFEIIHVILEKPMSEPSGMRGDRSRDNDGELRRKRGDTHIGSIEREYDVDLGVRSDMHLETYRERTGLDSVEDIVDHARKRKP